MPRVTKCGFDDIAGGASGCVQLEAWGPTLIVDIGFDPNFKPGQNNPPQPGLTGQNALVDTGASECCIDNTMATLLGLAIVDRRQIAGALGAGLVNMYLAQVRVPALNFVMYGQFAGVDLIAGGQHYAVLMGRTFLRAFTMVYEGATGTVTLTAV